MEFIKEELERLKRNSQLRTFRLTFGPQEAKTVINGKRLINLCSNNYLGLCNDRRLKKAAVLAINKYGIGSAASRLVCGNNILYQKLERAIARFKNSEASLVFNSGYCANLGVITSLMGKNDIVFSDRSNHASIIDAIILSRAEFRRYPHKDMQALERLLKASCGHRRRLIATDSVFSMDGDIAPLPDLKKLAKKYSAMLYIDEAHATAVLGKSGRGALEYFNLKDDEIIQMGTLSKAVGSLGAFVCGGKNFIGYLINKARPLIYTTALSPAICAASIAGIKIIQNDALLRDKLKENIRFFRKGLSLLGFKVSNDPTPIIPILIGDSKKTMEFSRKLFDAGIFIQGIRPPTVPKGTARLRISLMATHKLKDLEYALEKLGLIAKQMGII